MYGGSCDLDVTHQQAYIGFLILVGVYKSKSEATATFGLLTLEGQYSMFSLVSLMTEKQGGPDERTVVQTKGRNVASGGLKDRYAVKLILVTLFVFYDFTQTYSHTYKALGLA